MPSPTSQPGATARDESAKEFACRVLATLSHPELALACVRRRSSGRLQAVLVVPSR